MFLARGVLSKLLAFLLLKSGLTCGSALFQRKGVTHLFWPCFLQFVIPMEPSYSLEFFFFFSKETSHKNQPCPDLLINNHQQTRLRPPATHCYVSRSVASVSLLPYGLYPARLLCPWDSPGKNTRVGCCALLQGNLSHLQSNPGLLHCRQTLPSEPLGKTSNLHWHFF